MEPFGETETSGSWLCKEETGKLPETFWEDKGRLVC
jgi:hypothetical protein